MPPAFLIEYTRAYLDDLEEIDPFDIPGIREAVRLLGYQALKETRNRRPLKAPVPFCPEATWQVRVGGYRVLFKVVARAVTILRVRYKGSGTTEDMGP